MSSPIIFEKGTRDFSTLGLGLLSDAIQATTTEELNGQFIFEMDYPVSGNNADLIKENRIIVVNSGHILKRQGFIIRQIVRKIDLTMTVYAEHVSYATLDVALAPIGTISGDAKTALENWKRMLVPAVDFTVDSDILTTNSTKIGAPEFETARQGLGGHAGSILDVWGGEYQFDNWHIRLLKQRGKSANAIIAYGRNLISFEQDTNIADTYTSVYPYYQENSSDDGNKTHFLPERTVDSEFVGKYPNPKVLMLDLSNKFKDVADYSETKLRNYALSYIQSNNIGVPKVNMKISTVDLSRATGGFSEDIDLGDTVNVYFEKLGITTSTKVIKAVWNVLSDDYDKFEIGARRASLTESISELATTADENANKALNQALVALQSADGKTTIYYLNSSDPWPTNPKENDTAFVKDGENSIMYRYMFNNDTGMFSWVKILDSMSADQIKQRVSDALESGKAYSDKLVATNREQVNAVLDDVQAKQADITAQQAEFDTKAQGYANKALADAKANTLATATQTAKDAQDALDSAKTDLTKNLNKEVTDRANAVTALDTKAQGYATQAKADAISASTTADGVINKKIDDTASSITSTISQNKTDADGKITTAQSTATQALNGLATKVSQTVYDAKTGQLQTDLNTTTTTANQAKTDIVAIKSDNTKQDTRMTTIESDANGTKTTVSNLQTDLGKANGSISTLQQRADGIEATVSTLGQINQLFNTEFSPDFAGWYQGISPSAGAYKVGHDLANDAGWVVDSGKHNGSTVLKHIYGNGSNLAFFSDLIPVGGGVDITGSIWAMSTPDFTGSVSVAIYLRYYDYNKNYIGVQSADSGKWSTWTQKYIAQVTPTGAAYVSFNIQTNGSAGVTYYSQPMLTFSNKVGQYVPGNYNNNASVAKAQLTADNASLALSNYKSDADGRISKAQADIIVNANAITQKVSQSDYNAKTGDLTTKVNTAQSTADSATSTIGAYKTSNDARVASAESKITANANAITSKVSQSDYNTKTGQIDGQISSIKQTATSISQSVADVMTQVNNLQQVNLINNSDFRPDLSGWSVQSPSSGTVTTGDYDYAGNVMVLNNTAGGMLRVNSVPITLTGTTTVSYTFNYYIFGLPAGGTVYSQLTYLDSAMKEISGSYPGSVNLATTPVGSWQKRTVSNLGITPPTGATYIVFSFDVRGAGTKAGINRPILVKGGTVGDYVPGQYTNNDKISTVSQTVDSISSIVSDPTTGLTKRVQTAEGSISTVQSNVSDLQSKQTQTASGLTTEISNRQTGDTNTLTQAKDFTTSSISNSESGMRSQITQTSDAIIAQVNSINMVANSEFDPVGKGWYQVLPTTGSIVGSELAPGSLTTSFGDWPEAGGSQLVRYDSGSWYASEPRQASSGKQYSASIVAGRTNLTTSVALDLRILWLDSSKKVVGYSSAGNIINTASYTGLKLYKLENRTSPANTAFVSIAIAHSGATSGGYDVVGRPMLNIGSKVGTYSPTYAGTASTTQLALLKDNWSIGIADNAGAITNGIVGNSTNMSLISNNVVINAPSTQIKGTAWINSAMIGNGQIGTAQIGDASITSAKIMNLDVNKITGNVSNWVLSQWTSATGSKVTIDGNGLYFSPGTSRMTTYGFEAWRRESSGNYAAMGMLGSYAWETDQDINGVGLIAKYYGVPHDDPNGPWKNEVWGGDTIAIGALEPQIGRGYNYVTPYMIFPSSSGIGEKYFPGNGNDTIIMSRWLSIYTGLNMRGHSIVNSSGYSLKENFGPVSGSDALDIFDNTEIMTYDYKPDSDDIDARTLANMQDKVGFVINDNGESPFKTDPRLVRYGNTRDDSVTVGYLMAAVKELHAKVKELETQLGK